MASVLVGMTSFRREFMMRIKCQRQRKEIDVSMEDDGCLSSQTWKTLSSVKKKRQFHFRVGLIVRPPSALGQANPLCCYNKASAAANNKATIPTNTSTPLH